MAIFVVDVTVIATKLKNWLNWPKNSNFFGKISLLIIWANWPALTYIILCHDSCPYDLVSQMEMPLKSQDNKICLVAKGILFIVLPPTQ